MAKHQRMFINARQSGEIRVALVQDRKLIDLDVELSHRAQKKANIYKAKVSRVEPSLNAIFVDYGSEKHGFLPVKDIAPELLPKNTKSIYNVDLTKVFKPGQELLVQIDKEERGSKGAAVSSYITLAGCYLVLMPNNPGAGGISRRIEGEDRQAMKEMLNSLSIPEETGAIIRTACIGRSQEELQWDIDALWKLWQTIKEVAEDRPAPSLIYQESDVILRAIRDSLRHDIKEIIVDTRTAYNRVIDHIQHLRPDFIDHVKLYDKDQPLFTHYGIESQIETAYQREVRLPSGASIVIDPTEALVAIDINSAKATKGGNIDETALAINLEAAEEIARQLKLRDLGGLIVIDFIDMVSNAHQRKVEERLAQKLKSDRARTQIGRISRFGLLEMSRQRLQPSLQEAVHTICPLCEGHGTIRSVQSLSNSMLRQIRGESLHEKVVEIHVQAPVEVATYLLNEKRDLINEIQVSSNVTVIVIPNPNLQTPKYDIQKIKTKKSADSASHKLIAQEKPERYQYQKDSDTAGEEPAVTGIEFENAPQSKKLAAKGGLFNRLRQSLFGNEETVETPPEPAPAPAPEARQEKPNRQRQQGRQKGKQGQQQRNNQDKRTKKADHNRQQNQNQKSNIPKPEKPAPKKAFPVKASAEVKAILAKDSVLSNADSVQTETNSSLIKPMAKEIAFETDIKATDFSLKSAQQRLAALNDEKMQMIDSKAKSGLPAQDENLQQEVQLVKGKRASKARSKAAS